MKVNKVFVACSFDYWKNNMIPTYTRCIERELKKGVRVCFVFPVISKNGKIYTGSVFPMKDGDIVYDLDLND